MATVRLVRIDANLPFACFRGRGGNWVGLCEPLKLTVQSPTYGELLEDFNQTLDAILQDLLESNELPKFLQDKGWKLQGRIPRRDRNIRFDVPFTPTLIPSSLHGPARQVRQ